MLSSLYTSQIFILTSKVIEQRKKPFLDVLRQTLKLPMNKSGFVYNYEYN